MSSKATKTPKAAKPSAKPKPRPGVQVVLRVPEQTKLLLAKMAHEAHTSMNAAACERLASGRWPAKGKEERS